MQACKKQFTSAATLIALLMLLWPGAAGAQVQDLIQCEQLHAFLGGAQDGEYLLDPVIEGRDGRLYGTTINGGVEDGGVVFALAKDGSQFVILHDFTGSTNNGIWPWGGVIQGQDGKLYGAARYGGTQDAGVVFSLNTDGTGFTNLHSFTTNANEGAYPLNTVIQGRDGRLYGRTLSGGTNDSNIIFGLNTNGTGYAVLHSFSAEFPYWDDSYSGLVEGSDGLLYGTTYCDGAYGDGSVFRLQKDGTSFQTLHDFKGSSTEGYCPFGSVYETREGVLYGTTSYGGPDDYGMLYKINRDGTGYAILRYFIATNSEGYLPVAPPVEGPGDLLYGTTYFDDFDDGGIVYCVRKDGSGFAWLYRFKWDLPEGTDPNARMIRGSDGALYGTTFSGNDPGAGSVFRIKPAALLGRQPGNHFTVRFEGFASQVYGLDAADRLPPSWTRMATITNLTGTVEWSETGPGARSRFYRAQVLNP
jgi:uncharacterized repeat protein (TIGR03803 family)